MKSNIEKYKAELEGLITKGDQLSLSMTHALNPEEYKVAAKKAYGDKYSEAIAKLPDFRGTYQLWYSEAYAVIRQLIPERLSDFVRFYEKAKNRKEIDSSNYAIEDYLQGITVTRGMTVVVSLSAALPKFEQQYAQTIAFQLQRNIQPLVI
ncbi:hypothetical protein [Sideroxydans lithotrophicus]|uniref:hypothetical protein n=1 Tax=Sideroxydans lithotrophicus TaxID=63745 RepID=UPI00059DC6D8|nr:hypothetical protein [Sideroxydans lithotrophicus]